MRHSKKGFTLIEILVVISIIALLAGITIRAVGPARVRGRDAQRVSDLANIRIALALYKSATSTGKYPIMTSWIASGGPYASKWRDTDAIPNNSLAEILSPFISLPNDPINAVRKQTGDPAGTDGPWYSGVHYYAYISNGVIYDLVAQFENRNNPDRCAIKRWKYHSGGEVFWCPPTPSWSNGAGSPYLYADH